MFVKVFKWFLSMSFFICGIAFLRMTEEMDNIKPMGVAVLCMGVVFWLSKSTYEAEKKIFFVSVAMLILSAAVAKYLAGMVLMQFFGWDLGFYWRWEISLAAVCVPIMIYVLGKDG